MSLRSVILPALGWLAACATPPESRETANLPPEFSGDFERVVIENATVAFSVEVADPDGDPVEITLKEGDDSGRFTLDATTLTVSALETFDFERPVDVDGNNVYELVVAASDGNATTEQRYTVRIDNDEGSFDELGATVLIGEVEGDLGRQLTFVDDTDGDGRRELLVSAPSAFVNEESVASQGRAYLVLGEALLDGPIDLDALTPEQGVSFEGFDSANAGFGLSALGDLDGDGRPELAITASRRRDAPPGEEEGIDVGEILIVSSADVQRALSGDGVVRLVEVSNRQLGLSIVNRDVDSLVTARLDGDTLDDLVICAPRPPDFLGLFVVFGDVISDAFASGRAIDIGAAVTAGEAVRLADSPALDRLFCQSALAIAGDVDGDGRDHLLVGSPRDGGVALIPGAQIAGARTAWVLTSSDALDGGGVLFDFPPSGVFLVYGAAGLGDLNADGVDDFALGHERHDNDAGEAFVVFGSNQLANASEAGIISRERLIDQNLGIRIFGTEPSGSLGVGMASAGDLDQDGLQELIVSAPGNEGKVFVILGSELTEPGSIDLAQIGKGVRGVQIHGIDPRDLLRRTQFDSTGDLNGDGTPDIVIGAPDAGVDGEVYVLSGAMLLAAAESTGQVALAELFPELVDAP
ncbi:MAG: hypothetical protein AAGA48_34625 [Myxococcota bacterium]